MTEKAVSAQSTSVDLPQLISALQAMGIVITTLPSDVHTPAKSEPASQVIADSIPPAPTPTPLASAQLATNTQSSPGPDTVTMPVSGHVSSPDNMPRTVSARISSPWVPTSVTPVAAPATDTFQQQVGSSSMPSAATASDDGSAFTCPHCLSTILRPSAETWYTVTAGRNVGVFRGWHRAQPLVSGVPHASFRKYSSEAAATAAFEDAIAEGLVVVIN